MDRLRLPAALLALLLLTLPASAVKSDRTIVTMTVVEVPAVPVEGLDYGSVRVEIAHPEIEIGDPQLRETKTFCVPKGSENRLKDVVEIPTHYYEVTYRVGDGVMLVFDGDGRTLWSEHLDGYESNEKFGYDECRYWLPSNLEEDFGSQRTAFAGRIRENARGYFTRITESVLDRTLFYRVIDENYPIHTFRDKHHDYTALDEAAGLAETGYRALEASAEAPAELRQAIAIWQQELEQMNAGDKNARINRKVAAKLHVNIGAALLALGDAGEAVVHLERAATFGTVGSNSKDVGAGDLLDRARERKLRSSRNPDSGNARPADLEGRIAATSAHRGTIPIEVLRASELARLRAAYGEFVGERLVEAARPQPGQNPYERMVSRTSVQGFVLFLMPFPKRLETFPVEVCELTHLNQLRVAGHGYESVPDEIGELKELRVLDLSGNRLETVPASIRFLDRLSKLDLSNNQITSLPLEIGDLKGLKKLNLKGNPLGRGEVERLRQLLPGCNIKL